MAHTVRKQAKASSESPSWGLEPSCGPGEKAVSNDLWLGNAGQRADHSLVSPQRACHEEPWSQGLQTLSIDERAWNELA